MGNNRHWWGPITPYSWTRCRNATEVPKSRKTSFYTVHTLRMIDQRLVTFRVFASTGTVAKTAELTGLSASAVSSQLRELQRSLDVSLVRKDGRGLTLTAAGRELLSRSDALMAQWEDIKAALVNASGHSPEHFTLAGFSTAAANLLAPLAARLSAQYSSTHVHVIEAEPERCLDLLLAEQVDLSLIVAIHSHSTLEFEDHVDQVALLDDPLDVIVPSTHPAAVRESVTLAELSNEVWITGEAGGPYRRLFDAALIAAGISPRVSHEVVEWDTSLRLVAEGLGIGLVPRLVRTAGIENVKRLRIGGAYKPQRKIVAAMRRGSAAAPLVRDSLAALRDISAQIMDVRLREEV